MSESRGRSSSRASSSSTGDRAAAAERELARLKANPPRIEVPVIPPALAEGMAELAARAESLADKAEDRLKFRDAMAKIGIESPRSGIAHTMDEARAVLEQVKLPCVIRPSFTLGGTGGGEGDRRLTVG